MFNRRSFLLDGERGPRPRQRGGRAAPTPNPCSFPESVEHCGSAARLRRLRRPRQLHPLVRSRAPRPMDSVEPTCPYGPADSRAVVNRRPFLSAGKPGHDDSPPTHSLIQLAWGCAPLFKQRAWLAGRRTRRCMAEPRPRAPIPIGAPPPSRSNTGDQLRSSVACAGFVSCIPWLGMLPHSASQASTLGQPGRGNATPVGRLREVC